MTLHPERVSPRLNPGGLWLRISTSDQLVREYGLSFYDAVEAHALVDAELTNGLDGRLWLHFYDGDTGECMSTITWEPK